MKDTSTFQLTFAAVGGWLGYLLGGLDGFLYALIAFVGIDYLTGVMVAIIEKRLSSEVGARGIFKKVLIFTLVGIGNIVDVHLIKNGSAIRTAVIFSTCLTRVSVFWRMPPSSACLYRKSFKMFCPN